jgi:hypothetical protein
MNNNYVLKFYFILFNIEKIKSKWNFTISFILNQTPVS